MYYSLQHMKKNPDFLKSDTLKQLRKFLYTVTDDCKYA